MKNKNCSFTCLVLPWKADDDNMCDVRKRKLEENLKQNVWFSGHNADSEGGTPWKRIILSEDSMKEKEESDELFLSFFTIKKSWGKLVFIAWEL